MPRRFAYKSQESDLIDADRIFLGKYRKFQDLLRNQKISPLGAASAAEHRQSIKHKAISVATQEELINELLRYHGWACMEQDQHAHRVRLAEIVVSYDDLYSYCKFLEQERGVKIWSLNKICQAIIGMLKFMKSEVESIDESGVDDMLEYTRALYASIARSARVSLNERPTLCERRERGEALSLLDIVKVCEAQHWRVKALSAFSGRNIPSAELKKTVRLLLEKEVTRLAVLFTLLKYPTRKIEAQRCVVEKAGETWRFKLSAADRKSGRFPINVRLSPMEVEMFKFLRNPGGANTVDSWQPFVGLKITEILRTTTFDMTGVKVTVTDLRSAAESHVDIIGYDCNKQSENIQKALSYVEGHSENIAKMFYKRNGSSSIMKAWTAYVNKLMNSRGAEGDNEMSSIDQQILNRINSSQKRWVEEVQSKVRNYRTVAMEASKKRTRKRRVKWLAEEDEELRNCVRIHGKGNWKAILDSSPILLKRYTHTPVEKAREGLKDRWRNLEESNAVRYPRHTWSLAEDNALELAVSIYGTNWKEILDNSKMFQEIYCHVPVEKARASLRDHWRHLNAEGDIAKPCMKAKPAEEKIRIELGAEKIKIEPREKKMRIEPVEEKVAISPSRCLERKPRLDHPRRKKKGRKATLNKNSPCKFRFAPISQEEDY